MSDQRFIKSVLVDVAASTYEDLWPVARRLGSQAFPGTPDDRVKVVLESEVTACDTLGGRVLEWGATFRVGVIA